MPLRASVISVLRTHEDYKDHGEKKLLPPDYLKAGSDPAVFLRTASGDQRGHRSRHRQEPLPLRGSFHTFTVTKSPVIT